MVKTKHKLSPEQIISSYDEKALLVHETMRNDPVAFCELAIDPPFKPNRVQKQVLQADLHRQRTLLPWGRGFGKSHLMSRKIAHDLFRHKGMSIFLFSPAEDQSQLIFREVHKIYQTSEYLSKNVPYKLKGTMFTVGDAKWNSSLELLKVGLDARTARGRHTSGCGYLVGDEINSHLFAELISDLLEPFIVSGGGLCYLSSPGEKSADNFMYQTFLDWSEQEKIAIAEGRKPRHRVYKCKWSDCDHLDRSEVLEQLRKHKRRGTMYLFRREYLGAWTSTEGAYFAARDIDSCTRYDMSQGDKKSTWVWSIDPAGRGSSFVIHIARLNQKREMMEIVKVLSFIFEGAYRQDSGDETINEFEQIVDALLETRKKYPPTLVYFDPNCERALSERLENQFHFPMKALRIGGYDSKKVFLEDLRRALQDRTIAFNDPRIIEQLKTFSPKLKSNGEFEFPKKFTDHVVCAGMIAAYLGDREVPPWGITSVRRKIW